MTVSHTHIIREDGDERKLFHDDEGLDVFGDVLSIIHYLAVIKLWGRGERGEGRGGRGEGLNACKNTLLGRNKSCPSLLERIACKNCSCGKKMCP